MQGNSTRFTAGVSRRHLVAGAVGALALPVATHAFARGIEAPATEADTCFMRMAIEEAALGDYPFGAVIVRDGEVLARGRNLGKQEKDPTAHGEMVAIRKFLAAHGPEMLKGTTLYTSGESCPMCMGAVVWCGAASFTGLQSPRLRPRSARSWSPTPRLRPRRRFRTSPSPGAFSPTRR